MHHFNYYHLKTNAMMSHELLTSQHIEEIVSHDLEVRRVPKNTNVQAITIELKIGLLDEALNRHEHHLNIEQLVAPLLLICKVDLKKLRHTLRMFGAFGADEKLDAPEQPGRPITQLLVAAKDSVQMLKLHAIGKLCATSS